jgi:hypothetical protein
MKAIILLGSHGAGKDTIANELIARHPKVFCNVKFSTLLKKITANAFYTTTARLEEKKWRNEIKNFGVSPLNVLNALFYGYSYVPELAEAIIDYGISSIPKHATPVFTDIRRVGELEAVYKNYEKDNVYLLRVLRDLSTPDGTDTYVNYSVVADRNIDNNKPLAEVVDDLEKLICIKDFNYKPEVHMYHASFRDKYTNLKELDYTSAAFDKILKALKEALPEEPDEIVYYLTTKTLQTALLNECNVEIADITEDCYLNFDISFPLRLVEKIREKATIIWHTTEANAYKLGGYYEPQEEVIYED